MGLFDFFKAKDNKAITQSLPQGRAPQYFNFTEVFSISGFKEKIEDWQDFLQKNADFDYDYDDLKELYDIGNKIYEYEAIQDKIVVTTGEIQDDKIPVYFNDKYVGYIGKSKSGEFSRLCSSCTVRNILPVISGGAYRHIVKNDDYDPEVDDPEDKKWVTTDYPRKLIGKIELLLQKEI